jgi:hypothetical protein
VSNDRRYLAITGEQVPQFGRRRQILTLYLTGARILRCSFAMGNAISPRGDMLKNRVQLECQDAPCRQFTTFPLLLDRRHSTFFGMAVANLPPPI